MISMISPQQTELPEYHPHTPSQERYLNSPRTCLPHIPPRDPKPAEKAIISALRHMRACNTSTFSSVTIYSLMPAGNTSETHPSGYANPPTATSSGPAGRNIQSSSPSERSSLRMLYTFQPCGRSIRSSPANVIYVQALRTLYTFQPIT